MNTITISVEEYKRLKDIETRYEIMREQMLHADYVPLYQQIVLNIVDEYAELHQDDMQEWCK